MNTEYSLIEHNDNEKYLVISSLGWEIKIDYPIDISTFEELSIEELDIIVSGFIINLEQYVAPDVSVVNRSISSTIDYRQNIDINTILGDYLE